MVIKKGYAYKKEELFCLKATIKGFTIESHRIRAREINPNKKEKRASAWARKRDLGATARYHQLAYAMLLGKKYSQVEQNTPLKEFYTKSDAQLILEICKLYINRYFCLCENDEIDNIVTWLTTDESLFEIRKQPKKQKTFTEKGFQYTLPAVSQKEVY